MPRFPHSLPVPAFVAALLAGGCDGSGPSGPPVEVSLTAPALTDILEAQDQSVRVSIGLDPVPATSVLVQLVYSGSATRGYDYTASADTVLVPARTAAAGVDIDIFRDFDVEDDESITISLGEIEGHGKPGAATRIDLNIIDGGGADIDRQPIDRGPDVVIFPTHYAVTEESVEFSAVVLYIPEEGSAPATLIVEWSSDPDFSAGVNVLGRVDVPALVPGVQTFLELHDFSLPLSLLAPNQSYYVRMYLTGISEQTGPGEAFLNSHRFAFATNTEGKVVTRCEAPTRAPGAAGSDPLFAEQWHLQNSGQASFAANPGIPGADLRMAAAIRGGSHGDGVKLAVVDTGLEICHPDLAANMETDQSFNFIFENSAGAFLTDPFNHDIRGDHGTSVAGVAAAVANNGLGGRGVAPEVELRGYNPGAGFSPDFELLLLRSLGASAKDPDSASAHIFNMSFGINLPAQNPSPDFAGLFRMGTTDLRSGRGALYVKAAGNAFSFCEREPLHPLNAEIGCIGANADPDQNLPWLINVGAFNANDVKSSYSSAGANLWVAAPAGEDGVKHPAIITTDQVGVEAGYGAAYSDSSSIPALPGDGDYISTFGGTSSAAPAAAGAIAILLGVNPRLTWRDVKHVLAASARRIDAGIRPVRAAFNGTPFVVQHAWQTNAAGYAFHNWYGFGAIAIDDAVAAAVAHTPDSLGELVESPWFDATDLQGMSLSIPDHDGAGVTHTLEVSGLPGAADIEATILEIGVGHRDASDIGIQLTSPGGTRSILNAPFNVILNGYPGWRNWQLLSNAFYGESPNGSWTIRVVDLADGDTGHLRSWRLRFHYGDHP